MLGWLTPFVSWRNIFFFEGLVTMLIALSATFFMPQSPGNWKYLSPRQQYIAAERIRREHDAVWHPSPLVLSDIVPRN
jgi:predicted MFS family arabinose efflux permease